MGDINAQLDPAATAKVMQEFARQNEYMNMREDLIGDALQDAVSGSHITTSRPEGVGGMLLRVSCLFGRVVVCQFDGDEEEEDAVVNQVLDEIGLQVGKQVSQHT